MARRACSCSRGHTCSRYICTSRSLVPLGSSLSARSRLSRLAHASAWKSRFFMRTTCGPPAEPPEPPSPNAAPCGSSSSAASAMPGTTRLERPRAWSQPCSELDGQTITSGFKVYLHAWSMRYSGAVSLTSPKRSTASARKAKPRTWPFQTMLTTTSGASAGSGRSHVDESMSTTGTGASAPPLVANST